jgi:hypothetical protein
MNQIIFIGAGLPEPILLDALYQRGYSLTFTRTSYSPTAPSGLGLARAALLVLNLDADLPIARVAHALRQQGIPWLAWNRSDEPARAVLASASGALAVLPGAISAPLLLQAIDAALATRSTVRRLVPGSQQRYRRGAVIALERNAILEVTDGIVAQTMIHPDGAAVLLGLCGPGQTLIGHPADDCCIELVAHTDAMITLQSWLDAVVDPQLPERLRTRVQLMEAWAAMQARPYLDQRVLGILALLAEQFGKPHARGVLVDVRITHTQLATAVGATRSTITRILGDLRTRGMLDSVGSGERERFCLRTGEQSDHADGTWAGTSAHQSTILFEPTR